MSLETEMDWSAPMERDYPIEGICEPGYFGSEKCYEGCPQYNLCEEKCGGKND
ncbi:MAG: hypothetical protein ABIH49_01320 [archaeon]